MSEMDFISIDKFTNLKSHAYFLSHCHSDHMDGLDSRDFENALRENNAFLYMSHVSKTIIEKMYPYLVPRIKELDMPGNNFIDLPDIDKNFNVTLIPAGHCPGSVMFLFEYEQILLYTGDIRIRVNELKKYKELYDSTGNLKKIYNIYLDTTFFKKTYEHFPLREQSIKAFCDLINDWLKKNLNNQVSILTPAKYGSEYLFIETYQHLNQPIHVDEEKYKLYKCFPEMDKVVTLDATKTRIHNYCSGWNRWNKICLTEDNINILNIKPSAMIWHNYNAEDSIVKDTYSKTKSVCYSSHSSYTELIDIIKFLKPLNITPCVEPKQEKEMSEMRDLIKNILLEIHETDSSSEELESIETFENKTDWKENKVVQEQEENNVENKDIFNLLDSPESKKRKIL